MLGPHDLEDFYSTIDRRRDPRCFFGYGDDPRPLAETMPAMADSPAPSRLTPLQGLVVLARMVRKRTMPRPFARG